MGREFWVHDHVVGKSVRCVEAAPIWAENRRLRAEVARLRAENERYEKVVKAATKLASVTNRYCLDALPTDRSTADMYKALDEVEQALEGE
jgi:hypothetical protein